MCAGKANTIILQYNNSMALLPIAAFFPQQISSSLLNLSSQYNRPNPVFTSIPRIKKANNNNNTYPIFLQQFKGIKVPKVKLMRTGNSRCLPMVQTSSFGTLTTLPPLYHSVTESAKLKPLHLGTLLGKSLTKESIYGQDSRAGMSAVT